MIQITLPDGSTQIKISNIPEGIDTAPSTQGKRSLGRALWFSFLKFEFAFFSFPS